MLLQFSEVLVVSSRQNAQLSLSPSMCSRSVPVLAASGSCSYHQSLQWCGLGPGTRCQSRWAAPSRRREREIFFGKRGEEWISLGKKKIIFLLTFSIASMAFSGENLNNTIFKPKYEVFNFGSIGQVWAAQFLTVKQHIFALFFFFFFYRMLTFSDSFSFKCCFTEHFQ